MCAPLVRYRVAAERARKHTPLHTSSTHWHSTRTRTCLDRRDVSDGWSAVRAPQSDQGASERARGKVCTGMKRRRARSSRGCDRDASGRVPIYLGVFVRLSGALIERALEHDIYARRGSGCVRVRTSATPEP